MYPDVPLWLALPFVVGGIALLVWSADMFVDGACAIARMFGVSLFVVGMLVIGFGTSAPELAVSAISGLMGHSNLSLGNAYGSNIFNIAAILGVSAFIHPVSVRPMVAFVASPMLVGVAVLSCTLVCAGNGFSRMDGIVQLVAFVVLLPLYCWIDSRAKVQRTSPNEAVAVHVRYPWLVLMFGLALLVVASHILVWGAVVFARAMGVSELMIGLTIIAAGTSLPELASAIASARKGQHDFVLGNIIGSNFFNTLAVVGLSGTISPFVGVSRHVLSRDFPMMVILSLSILVFGCNWRKPSADGVITRWKGLLWIFAFLSYVAFVMVQELGA